MRVPKIQVMPDHHLDPLMDEADVDGPAPFGISRDHINSTVLADITNFYSSAMTHIMALALATSAQSNGTPDQMRARIMLDDMTNNLKEEEAWLVDAVREGRVVYVNNVRRRVAERVREVMGMFEDWERKWVGVGGGGGVKTEWKVPEYYR